MFEWITSPEAWIALATLTALEIVLGIDNIIFISILSGRLPKAQRQRARSLGLAGAMLMRVALLLSKPYIYFAMGFSVFVEMLNLRIRGQSWEARPVRLRQRIALRRPSPMPPKMRMIDGE